MNPTLPRSFCDTSTRDLLPTPHFPSNPVVNIPYNLNHYSIKITRILQKSPRSYKPYTSNSQKTSPIRSFQFKNTQLVKLPRLKPLIHVIRRKESLEENTSEKRFHRRVSSLPFIIHGNYIT